MRIVLEAEARYSRITALLSAHGAPFHVTHIHWELRCVSVHQNAAKIMANEIDRLVDADVPSHKRVEMRRDNFLCEPSFWAYELV